MNSRENSRERDSAEGLSNQQKIWKGISVLLYSLRPLLLYIIVPALVTMLGNLLLGGRDTREIIQESGNFYYTLGILATFYILYRQSKKRGSSLKEDVTLEYRGLERRKLLTLIGIGFGFGIFFSSVITVVPFPEVLMQSYLSSSEAVKDGTDPLLALLSTILLAPVVEEIIFRGYMLNRLFSWFDEKAGILIASAVFALCHVSLIWMVYAFLMGIMLAKVSVEEDNIAYSIALHMGFNLNVLPIWVVNHIPAWKQLFFSSHGMIALYGGGACFLAVWLLKSYRKETTLW